MKIKGNYLVSILLLFVSCNGNQPLNYLKIGNRKFKIGDFKGALSDYNKALEINPKNDTAYLKRAILEFEHPSRIDTIDGSFTNDNKIIQKNNAILNDLNTAIKINPNYTDAFQERGIINYNLAHNFQFLDNFKNEFLVKKYYNNALADFNKLKKLDDSTSIAYEMSGDIKNELHDYLGAIVEYSHVIEMYPKDANGSYYSRALCKLALNDYINAIKDFDILIRLGSRDNGLCYLWKGDCQFQIGEKEGACSDWSKAGELGITYAYDRIKKYCQ